MDSARRALDGTHPPFVQRTRRRVEHVRVRVRHVRESDADDVRAATAGAGAGNGFMEAPPPVDTLFERALEDVVRDTIIVATVALATHPLNDALVLEQARVDADARFADAQLFGELVERSGVLGYQQQPEQPARDARHAVRLEEDGNL